VLYKEECILVSQELTEVFMKGTFSIWFIMACVLCLCAPIVNAQGQDPAVQFEKADRFFKAGEYAEALKGFKAIYVETGESALLYNIAQCHRLLKQYDEAILSYKSYLREVPNSEIKDQINTLIQECETKKAAASTQPLAPSSEPKPVFVPPKPTKLPYVLYGVSGGSLIFSFASGRTALLQADKAKNLAIVTEGEEPPNPDEILQTSNIARRAATISTFTLAVAVAAAGGGFLLYKKSKKSSVALTWSGASLQIGF
jgi:tetratricopeptide (TPR) repeat protein